MMASRCGESIVFLMKKPAIKTPEQATEMLLSFFDSNSIMPGTEYTIHEAVNKINSSEREKSDRSAAEKNREKTLSPPKSG
ncbi:MAG: hypothetical protein LBP22_16570 [Deltaproteobacteria bacterium]|nr:hypothetical protein [Deltaproteobacteria bacterium]